ncbi:uncharacterized protein LOC128671268 [Plodia interpunctella]|uniref:uncharacterized protein LOC128671268 n=1 Tax=Plodia interpunctella TaxID=58824 RepID=UPI00236832A1|nr:uncharacterized protein LOC128671268 [Plodia interpunctella]
MALVLRKALLPKNVSLLKCIRGRPLTTTPKNNPAPLSKAALITSPKDEKVLPLGRSRFSRTKHLFESQNRRGCSAARSQDVRFCASCPNLVPESRAKPYVPVRHFSPPRFRFIFRDPSYKKSSPVLLCISSHLPDLTSKRPYSKCPPPCGPCPGPCGCACLPPPCNVPPRCLQFMTGYYYYPYGTWFCGPYHVTKPACCPVGPCGCGPCGPPCGPCGPCGPCCICPGGSAAPALASTASAMIGAAPKEHKPDIFPGEHISFPPTKDFEETRQQNKNPPKQSSQHQKPKSPFDTSQNQKSKNPFNQNQKSKNPFNMLSSINVDKPISPSGLKKVTPMVSTQKFKNITSPRVVPPVMSSTFVTITGNRFSRSGCHWSSRYMSSDVEPTDPTLPTTCTKKPCKSTTPSFQTYVTQVPLSHLNSASTPISAQTFTKAKHPYKLTPEYARSRGYCPIDRKLEPYSSPILPYETPKTRSPLTPPEVEYYSTFKHYSRPNTSTDWVFKKANADKLCPKFK